MQKDSSPKNELTPNSIVSSATALIKYIKMHNIAYDKLDDKTRTLWCEFLGLLDQIEKESWKAKRTLAREAKAIVLLAFRNGPIETVHAGKRCPTCAGNPEYSHISNEEMKQIMKNAVDQVYKILCERERDPEKYEQTLQFADEYTKNWDEPESVASRNRDSALGAA